MACCWWACGLYAERPQWPARAGLMLCLHNLQQDSIALAKVSGTQAGRTSKTVCSWQ